MKDKDFSYNYSNMRLTLELMCEIPEENMTSGLEHKDSEYAENSENA